MLDLAPLAGLHSLRQLDLSTFASIEQLLVSGLGALIQLTVLVLRNTCPDPASRAALGQMSSLRRLTLASLRWLPGDWPFMLGLTGLTPLALQIANPVSVYRQQPLALPDMRRLSRLEHLIAVNCEVTVATMLPSSLRCLQLQGVMNVQTGPGPLVVAGGG